MSTNATKLSTRDFVDAIECTNYTAIRYSSLLTNNKECVAILLYSDANLGEIALSIAQAILYVKQFPNAQALLFDLTEIFSASRNLPYFSRENFQHEKVVYFPTMIADESIIEKHISF